jgi:peptidoglycan/LPS O-acetylase OafA/YrhL
MSGDGHDNNFNLIRFAAAMQVLVVHSIHHFELASPFEPMLRLVPGVPAFFFLSGYLIYQSYERMHAGGDFGFYVNRVLRIYPALLVCFVVSVLSVWATGYFAAHPPPPGRFFAWVAAQVSFVQFFNPDFMRGYGAGVLNGALWTVSVELQFYALMPIVAWLFRRARVLLVILFVLSVAANLYLRVFPDWSDFRIKLLTVSFVPWIYMFLLGSFAAAWRRTPELTGRIGYLPLIAAYVLSMNFVGDFATNASNAINPVSFVILAVLLLKLAHARLWLPERVNDYFRRNDLSYGLYLYHMPIINLLMVTAVAGAMASAAAAMCIGLLAAGMSWYIVERPALRLKKRFAPTGARR